MHQKPIHSDRPSARTPDYLIAQRNGRDTASGAFLALFFAASILSVIVSTLIR